MGRKALDLTMQRFGKLVAKSHAPRNNSNQTMWNCRCDCGGSVVVATHNLKNGNTKSCGCNKHDSSTWTTNPSPSKVAIGTNTHIEKDMPDWLS